MKKVNNNFITRLKWKSATKEFNEMKQFNTDCFCYIFEEPLTFDQQNNFILFIGNADNLNSLSPIDFCNYFLRERIPFNFMFKYVKQLNPYENYIRYKIVKSIGKELNNLN